MQEWNGELSITNTGTGGYINAQEIIRKSVIPLGQLWLELAMWRGMIVPILIVLADLGGRRPEGRRWR